MNSTGVKQKIQEREVEVLSGNMALPGTLAIPAASRGMVVFAHGSGSSRHSPRNRFVAQILHEHGLATLLFDLLTPEEEAHDRISAHLRFDIELLTRRLVGATEWVEKNPATHNLHLGYFGASTGAAAALVAAAQRGEEIAAVVSRGGRPDLAGAALERVAAATLLIVGGEDTIVLDLNREALAALGCVHKKLTVVPGATHLFEEPGALEKAGKAAAEWFERYLGAESAPEPIS
jgi:putative phosphoribosyl transferase